MTFPKAFYRWRPHPWHGLEPGPDAPAVVQAYIEITPFDSIKYEVDKATGYLRVDRPQRSSSLPPLLYGFVPRTFCGSRVGALMHGATRGDGDPLDICVLSDRPIARAEILLNAHVVGGLEVLDNGEADDKIVAVLANDNVWGHVRDISELPPSFIERLRHYFATYKLVPGEPPALTVQGVYGRERALRVVQAALDDYAEEFGG